MTPIYIFDLDGCLANTGHREHFITGPEKNWPAFFNACDDDEPIQENIQTLNNLMRADAECWIWTGRPATVLDKTIRWMAEHLYFTDVKHQHDTPPQLSDMANQVWLQMRKPDRFMAASKLKLHWLNKLDDDTRSRIVAAFDDRTANVEAWRSAGITCYQVAQGDY